MLFDWCGQAKIADSDLALVIDKDIGRLKISVNDSSLVQKFDATKNIVKYRNCMVFRKLDFG